MKRQALNKFSNDEISDRATIVAPGGGEMLGNHAVACSLKITSEITNDQFGVYELTLQPGAIGANLHYHRFMDETFIVTQGTMTVQLSEKEIGAEKGSIAYIPRFTPHGFKNTSDSEVKVVLIFNPGQKREGFFRGLFKLLSQPQQNDAFLKLYERYDCVILGSA